MKQGSKSLVLLLMISLAAFTGYAQVIVKLKPQRPRVTVVKPVPPSPRHVWVEEEWVPEGRAYAWHGGYWVERPQERVTWVPGHWTHRKKGWVWIPGHWK